MEIEDYRKCVDECKQSIMGKVLGHKSVNLAGIRSFVEKIWNCHKPVRIAEIGPSLYQFKFESNRDLNRVLRGRPWIFDNCHFVVNPWKENMEKDEKAFSQTLIWVQVWHLPIYCLTKEVGKKIRVVFVDVEDKAESRSDCTR
ncbi:hypothetical protein ACH5RR_018415 [Cinchona calisaya]|uniref:DUF4283 domain-containing protein n=1 Tax=Cinchona calisaya TaxID=153742 RepID=A0ABD2ZLD2_9GENT